MRFAYPAYAGTAVTRGLVEAQRVDEAKRKRSITVRTGYAVPDCLSLPSPLAGEGLGERGINGLQRPTEDDFGELRGGARVGPIRRRGAASGVF